MSFYSLVFSVNPQAYLFCTESTSENFKVQSQSYSTESDFKEVAVSGALKLRSLNYDPNRPARGNQVDI